MSNYVLKTSRSVYIFAAEHQYGFVTIKKEEFAEQKCVCVCVCVCVFSLQAEIVKRLNGICAQVLPYLSQEVQREIAALPQHVVYSITPHPKRSQLV